MQTGGSAGQRQARSPAISAATVQQWAIAVVSILVLAFCSLSILNKTVHYGVNVPFWDEWDFIGTLRSADAGGLSWLRLVLTTKGEHDVGALILSSALSWHLTAMDELGIMLWNWSLAVVFCLLCMWITAKELSYQSAIPWVALAASGFFVFNPAAYQVWLWALPLVYVLVFLLAAIGVRLIQSRLPAGIKLIATGAVATAATFTLANGAVLWAMLPAFLTKYHSVRTIVARRAYAVGFALLFCGSMVACLKVAVSYDSPAHGSDAGLNIHQIVLFFLAYTGNFVSLSLAPQPLTLARAAGVLIMVLFFAASIVELRLSLSLERRRAVWIWIGIGGLSLVSGLGAAITRYSFGATYPLDASRYVLASSFLPVAVVILTTMALEDLALLNIRLKLYSSLLALLSVLGFIAIAARAQQTGAALPLMVHSYFQELHGKVSVAAVNGFELPEYRNIFPKDNFDDFKAKVDFLNRKGWLHPAVWDQQYLKRLPTSPDQGSAGFLETVQVTATTIELVGWAYLPERGERAHAIMVIADSGSGPSIAAVCFPTVSRSDVYAAIGNYEALSTGWKAAVPVTAVSGGSILIRAYAYDAVTGQAHLLKGSRTVQVEAGADEDHRSRAAAGRP
jgi:hypothetical protein